MPTKKQLADLSKVMRSAFDCFRLELTKLMEGAETDVKATGQALEDLNYMSDAGITLLSEGYATPGQEDEEDPDEPLAADTNEEPDAVLDDELSEANSEFSEASQTDEMISDKTDPSKRLF